MDSIFVFIYGEVESTLVRASRRHIFDTHNIQRRGCPNPPGFNSGQIQTTFREAVTPIIDGKPNDI